MTDQSPFIKHTPTWPATFMALGHLPLFLFFTAYILFALSPAEGWFKDEAFVVSASQLFNFIWDRQTELFDQNGWYYYATRFGRALLVSQGDLVRAGLWSDVSWRLLATLIATMFASFHVFASVYDATEPVSRLRHAEGREPIFGKRAAALFTRAERERSGDTPSGLAIAPNAIQAASSEPEHTLLTGSTGGGKTQLFKFWLDQIIALRRRALILCSKGDITAALPADSFILLAPHDDRSAVWDISADCQGLAAAIELAGAIIPMSCDPMWANASRAILTGIIRSLQLKGDDWGWAELNTSIFADPSELRTILDTYYSEAAQYIACDGPDGQINRTSYGFLVGLWAAAGQTISPLAIAWGNTDGKHLLSLTDWIADTSNDRRPVILQRAAQYPELSRAWMQAAISLLSNHAASPSLPDSPYRRIWMILDEFAQLGPIKSFTQLLEVGRSKGICCVIGLQSLSQVANLFDEDTLKTWLNLFGTKIIVRMQGGPAAQYLAREVIGNRRVVWTETSYSSSNSSLMSNDGRQAAPTKTWQQRNDVMPVIDPADLERDLGLSNKGGRLHIRGLVLKHGRAYFLKWPITKWQELHPGTVPAKWLRDDSKP